uniref:Squalene cyclase N-terminal domain-containing protein n=1 Tax=Oryza meridionalis TaxID=40149 RepID=A0A0E0DNK8_9ORYZ
MFIMPILIFALYITGSLDVVLSAEHRHGGWGKEVLGLSTMFGSCLNYVTLRLLGEERSNDALTKGHAWILSHGSAAAIPQWGKIWLSVIGLEIMPSFLNYGLYHIFFQFTHDDSGFSAV